MSTIDPEFDLIRLDSNENVGGVWIGTANSLREAVETIRIFSATRPGKYMVYSQAAGSKAIYQATSDNVTPLNGAACAMSGGGSEPDRAWSLWSDFESCCGPNSRLAKQSQCQRSPGRQDRCGPGHQESGYNEPRWGDRNGHDRSGASWGQLDGSRGIFQSATIAAATENDPSAQHSPPVGQIRLVPHTVSLGNVLPGATPALPKHGKIKDLLALASPDGNFRTTANLYFCFGYDSNTGFAVWGRLAFASTDIGTV
jgi:hypothetical protein